MERRGGDESRSVSNDQTGQKDHQARETDASGSLIAQEPLVLLNASFCI